MFCERWVRQKHRGDNSGAECEELGSFGGSTCQRHRDERYPGGAGWVLSSFRKQWMRQSVLRREKGMKEKVALGRTIILLTGF